CVHAAVALPPALAGINALRARQASEPRVIKSFVNERVRIGAWGRRISAGPHSRFNVLWSQTGRVGPNVHSKDYSADEAAAHLGGDAFDIARGFSRARCNKPEARHEGGRQHWLHVEILRGLNQPLRK